MVWVNRYTTEQRVLNNREIYGAGELHCAERIKILWQFISAYEEF